MSYNLEIVQGTDYQRTFTVYDIYNNIVPLSGFTLTAHVRRNHSATEIGRAHV